MMTRSSACSKLLLSDLITPREDTGKARFLTLQGARTIFAFYVSSAFPPPDATEGP